MRKKAAKAAFFTLMRPQKTLYGSTA